jgi:type II secretory pathway pseudopilin PulG
MEHDRARWRIRISTLMLLVIILALALTLVIDRWKREQERRRLEQRAVALASLQWAQARGQARSQSRRPTGGGGIIALPQDPNVARESTTITATAPRDKDVRPEFANEPGWMWLMRPQEMRIGRSWGQAGEDGMMLAGYSIIDSDGGPLRIFLAQAGPNALDGPAYRLVVFDEMGRRHLPKRGEAGGLMSQGNHLTTAIFTLAPKELAPDKAAYIGVERRTP